MALELVRLLPQALKLYILLFDRRFIMREGKLVTINRLDLTQHENIIKKPSIWLEQYCDFELKEYVVYFSNPTYKLFYNVQCEKIVFEKTTDTYTIWYPYYLR